MKMLIGVLFCSATTSTVAFANTKFSFQNEELIKMIEIYVKASGQKFVVDPGVRGKATIYGADDVTNEEAFNLLSSALAVNGYAISVQGDTMLIEPARVVARDLNEVTTTLPSLKPQRIVTYMYQFKNIPADYVMKEFRFLPSKDGEMSSNFKANGIIMTDWSSNVQKFDQVAKQLDQPVDPKVAKFVEANRKEMLQALHERATQIKSEKGGVAMPSSYSVGKSIPAVKAEPVKTEPVKN